MIIWFANYTFLRGSIWGHLSDMNSLLVVVSSRNPDFFSFDGEQSAIDAPWMSSIGVQWIRLSSSDSAIADQFTLIVVPHQFNRFFSIILEVHSNLNVSALGLASIRLEAGDRGREVGEVFGRDPALHDLWFRKAAFIAIFYVCLIF
jgi:hypothetical protein